MIINNVERWVYLAPPKTGSTTLHVELVRAPWNGRRLDPAEQHEMRVPDFWHDFLILATVRCPYCRAVSLYWHYLRDIRAIRCQAEGIDDRDEWTKYPLPHDEFSLERFMEMVIARHLEEFEPHDFPFYVFCARDWLIQAPRVDVILHLENLNQEFNRLAFVGDRRANFGKHNAPMAHPSWPRSRNTRAIELINQWAAQDFEHYGYPYQMM
jgi:hypothetical protein